MKGNKKYHSELLHFNVPLTFIVRPDEKGCLEFSSDDLFFENDIISERYKKSMTRKYLKWVRKDLLNALQYAILLQKDYIF